MTMAKVPTHVYEDVYGVLASPRGYLFGRRLSHVAECEGEALEVLPLVATRIGSQVAEYLELASIVILKERRDEVGIGAAMDLVDEIADAEAGVCGGPG